MQRRILVGLTAVAVVTSGLTVVGPVAQAAPVDQQHQVDDLPSPAEEKRRALRQQALADVLTGERTAERRGSSTVVKMGTGTYVELARAKTDKIFVVLAEFGTERHPDYPDQDTHPNTPGPVSFEGPLHNQIPEPDRAVDNTTIWQPDYDRQHYEDLYFAQDADSMANYFEKQSSGRYSVDGTVSDWVKVRYNVARYGRSRGFPCAGIVCTNSYELVRDAVNQWYADQLAAGRTPAQITADLAQYDVWDRTDFDGDGNFDERDGYLDHFQIVSAGGGESDGNPIYGEDAMWPHRAFAFSNTSSGPAGNFQGGTQIGTTGLWVGDYTLQPENGGVGVFAHEYGHDLGLPDLYDTTRAGNNHVNWWSLMAQHRVSGEGEAYGFRANDLDPWSKLQLGWLDYEVVVAGQQQTIELGPHEYQSEKAQGVVVVLPDKAITFDRGDPFEGANQWWSNKGDNLDTKLTRTVDLTGKTTAALTMKARYDIEEDFDYLYVQASTDGGQSWTSLDGTANG